MCVYLNNIWNETRDYLHLMLCFDLRKRDFLIICSSYVYTNKCFARWIVNKEIFLTFTDFFILFHLYYWRLRGTEKLSETVADFMSKELLWNWTAKKGSAGCTVEPRDKLRNDKILRSVKSSAEEKVSALVVEVMWAFWTVPLTSENNLRHDTCSVTDLELHHLCTICSNWFHFLWIPFLNVN